MNSIILTQPDDWHLHLRDGALLACTVPHAAQQFARAIVMPNLQPAVLDIAAAATYRQRILAARPEGSVFQPLMTLYLTDNTPLSSVKAVQESEFIHAFKLYPAGATTNSAQGVNNFDALYPFFAEMEKCGVPLLIHGEFSDPSVDVFDREKVFIEQQLVKLTREFPQLKIVLEHITTSEAVSFITESSDNIAATITAHHLLYDRNAIFSKGINPHFYCLPILKRNSHQKSLIQAATSGNKKFFLGTDSAPHAQTAKETTCGCAGIYTAYAAIELYAEAFNLAGALDKLEGFSSHFGADFYGLPRNKQTITLQKRVQKIPDYYSFGDEKVIPLRAGQTISWSLLS